MKFKIFLIPFISLFIPIAQLQAEGFVSGTLIKIPSGYVPIEHLIVQNNISIAVHNAHPLVVPIFWGVVAAAEKLAEAAIATGTALLGAHLAHKIAKKHKYAASEKSENWSATIKGFGGGNWKDPDDNNDKAKKTHPHGIYEESPYHHKNAHGRKSPAPKNGQHCLDYSLPTEGTQRIAIEGDNFVILKYTSPGKYHGYIIEWKSLERALRSIFINNGFAKKSGKIIKQITEKSLL